MTGEEAVVLAAAWVWARYPRVPAVNGAWELCEQPQDPLELRRFGASRTNCWLVSFFCNWDTDALGLPPTLNVLVDGDTASVTPLTP